jgi:hypothetical protein
MDGSASRPYLSDSRIAIPLALRKN